MIIETKFRDIPFDECCCKWPSPSKRSYWNEHRGQSIRIITPPVSKARGFKCKGPFYKIADDSGFKVCTHIAEIGD